MHPALSRTQDEVRGIRISSDLDGQKRFSDKFLRQTSILVAVKA
jgi:hypothetical protein